MKKIGFVDYYISEWHANNYPKWIEQANAELGTDYKVSYAWAALDTSLTDGRTTDEWCKAFGVEKCASCEELCEKSDVILLLSPSNPEQHLELAKKVLPYGKRTYIDKTFAPDYATAAKIIDLAVKYNTEFFSTSALRYADELKDYDGNGKYIHTTGGGRTLDEYSIHQIEMIVKTLGLGAASVSAMADGDRVNARINYDDGRAATLFFAPCMPFTAVTAGADGVSAYHNITSDYFLSLIKDILRFYENGGASFPVEQTREVMKVREALLKAAASGKTVKV